ncbi:MAG: hypothetical protein RL365_1805 [Bacteroidota bacterium]
MILKSRKIPAFFLSLSVREDGLQWAWSKGLISGVDANSKHPILVVHTGTWNRFAPGPDFQNACIRIGNITWYGDIEIHIKSSDWVKHKHQTDPKYRNVILHVVAENDLPLAFQEELIPTLVVETQIISNLTYWNKKDEYLLPCRFGQHNFSTDFMYSFWRKRMNRKQQEYSNEKEIAAYILKQNSCLCVHKRNARQRHVITIEAALKRLRNTTTFQRQNLLLSELKTLKDEIMVHLTAFESQSILINGVIPYLWNPQNEAELYAFAKTIPPERNRIISQFKHILPTTKNAYETQALLEINRQLCSRNKCLTCEVGKKILNS